MSINKVKKKGEPRPLTEISNETLIKWVSLALKSVTSETISNSWKPLTIDNLNVAHIEQDNDFDLDEEASEETELQDLINEINAGDNDSENEDENLTNLPGFTEQMLSFEVFIKEEEIVKIEPLYLK